ncbi:pyrroloquinoline quinone biosynthesis protein PqqF [Pantoea sp.]|uniref:pyrroloquinoline quinone biosynthesis protein PqqF n=1 Tax=Pantoea sp. TaxID=69393 RepID=UPI0031D217BA
MTSRQLILANGLRCTLYHQPGARDAAALMRVEAGSLHEPDSWPGLAHLLEHLLFCGSERFNGDERLMPWVQQQGGQVNATTQLSRSAYFCQLPASSLSSGMQRLCDMLISPLLDSKAIQQEVAVIDAEYQLLQNHADTLSEAALIANLQGPFQRFRVGSHAAFGDNVTELHAALRSFHQRHYHADNMQLWLQGPQSLDELELIARQHGSQIAQAKNASTTVQPNLISQDKLLQLPGDESLWLSILIKGDEQALRDNVTLLSVFWQDEAPGSLLAQLRAEGLCENLHGQWLWQDAHYGWLALRFTAQHIAPLQAQRIEQRFWQHLAAISATTPAQQQHYARLAQLDFAVLAPLEQLRGRALGFAPGLSVSEDFAPFALALAKQPRTRLLTQQQMDGDRYQTQGFTLHIAEWLPLPALAAEPAAFGFFPATHAIHAPRLPPVAQTLPIIAAVQQVETLLLRPAFHHTLSDDEARARQRLLRPVLAELRHAGGSGYWHQKQGMWQLRLNLPECADQALWSVQQAIQALNVDAPKFAASAAPTIVIRELMAALPNQFIKPMKRPQWLAAWCGSDSLLSQRVAHLLSDFQPDLANTAAPAVVQRGIVPIACAGRDQALLLFMPLPQPDDASLAALRVLALMLETRFFQRLRVEQQIGYVVSARYQRVADVDGVLLALQSPNIPWRTLLGHCKRFMRVMAAELGVLPEKKLALWQHTLLTQAACHDNAEVAVETLRQQHGLATLHHAAIQAVTLPQLQHIHQRLLRERHRWLVLVNQS